MEDQQTIVERVIAGLEMRAVLSPADRATIAALAFRTRTINAGSYLVREGQQPERCAFIVDGFAYRQKLSPSGDRAIVTILVPGDFVDLQNLFLDESDHDVQALTRMFVAEIAIADLRDLALSSAGIGRALWVATLIEASIHREWLLAIGRRNAQTRMAHLLCEFQVRLHVAVGDAPGSYELPMTQEQLGDALGLTQVHVNRVLKVLERAGLIARRKRQVSVVDWRALRDAADFNDCYLHLAQLIEPAER